MGEFRIRDAVIDDCTVLLQQNKEFAIHHKEDPNNLTVTVEDLRRDGFGDNPLFKCHVAENINPDGSPGKILGHSMFFPTYTFWFGKAIFLEQLFVLESERGRGIGKALMKKLAQVCLEEGCTRLQLEVMDWNTKSLEFYLKQGAIDTSIHGRRRILRMMKPTLEKYATEGS